MKVITRVRSHWYASNPEIAVCRCGPRDNQQHDQQRRYRRQGIETAGVENESGDASPAECRRTFTAGC
jgi:hypothetical protein